MAKKTTISTTYELPEWFDLNSYKKVAELSEKELAEELSLRSLINRTTDIKRKKELFFDIEDYSLVANFPKPEDKEYAEWRLMFRSSPAAQKVEIPYVLLPEEECDPRYSPETTDDFFKEINAYESKMHDLWMKSKLAPLDTEIIRCTYVDEYETALKNSEAEGEYRRDLPSSPMIRVDDLCGKEDPHLVHITVDLRATDKAICDRLEMSLPLLRAHSEVNGPSKVVSDGNLRKLVLFHVIPYIDLWLWGKIYEKRVTDSVAARALFEDGTFGEPKIKDTIRPLAIAAMEPQFVNTLSERWEKSQRKNVCAQKVLVKIKNHRTSSLLCMSSRIMELSFASTF